MQQNKWTNYKEVEKKKTSPNKKTKLYLNKNNETHTSRSSSQFSEKLEYVFCCCCFVSANRHEPLVPHIRIFYFILFDFCCGNKAFIYISCIQVFLDRFDHASPIFSWICSNMVSFIWTDEWRKMNKKKLVGVICFFQLKSHKCTSNNKTPKKKLYIFIQ